MKKLILIIITLAMCLSLAACGAPAVNEASIVESDIVALKAELTHLENEKIALKNEIANIKVENGTAKYVITLNISQRHFTLDIGQHLKDAMNDISIQIPVDKEYYDSVQIGDVIDDTFRMGSLIFKGSFGNWHVVVEDKSIQ